jgi:hypothetical protein
LVVGVTALLLAAPRSSDAAPTGRVLGGALFVAGAGLHIGGIFAGNDASAIYDDYLLTASQAEIRTLRDEYAARRRTSRGLRGSGAGLMVAGALWVALSALHTDDSPAPVVFLPRRSERGLGVGWRRRF